MYLTKHKYLLSLIIISLICLTSFSAAAQRSEKKKDKKKTESTTNKDKKNTQKSKIEAPIIYSASDSIVLNTSGNAFLFGNSKVDYDKLSLTADKIHINTDSSTVSAKSTTKENGEVIGLPSLTDNGETYEAKTLRYNFVTKKGFIQHGVTQEGEAYIIGEQTKKVDDEILCMKNGKYTTCSDHDCPHFYLNLTKAKVKQKKWVVTGPAYLVMLDVPLPLVIPFGYFPFNKEYSSGVIIPSYGDDLDRGFYLSRGGYYFAVNDYMDLALTGDIYTKGTWATYANSTYLKKYKYRGNFNFSYREDITGEYELRNDSNSNYSKLKNLAITWTHTQDPKASPNRTLSASVNFSTSGYDRSNISNYSNLSVLSQNTKSSSISLGYRFPETPFSMTMSVLGSQRTADSTVSLTLPDLGVTMSRIYPFKKKESFGKDKWYEKIYMSYTGRMSNSIVTKEYKLKHSSLVNDWKNGADHSIPFGATFNVFKYIALTPSVNYHERWYLQSYNKSWDGVKNAVKIDTINSFSRVYDFSTGISASTKIYGFFTPNRKLFGDRIDRIRHVITPTLSYNFRPDFSDPYWGSWKSYRDSDNEIIRYSPYEKGIYGYPTAGKSSSMTFSLTNNLEMKWRHLNDSTGEKEYKTVSLIDALSVSGTYNFAADSLNWSILTAGLRLKLFKDMTVNLNGTFDTYFYGLDKSGNPHLINKLRWDYGELPRLMSTSTSFSYTINNQTFSKTKKTETPKDDSTDKDKDKNKAKKANSTDEDGYEKPYLPWSLSFDYSLRYGYTTFNKSIMEYNRDLSHNIGVRGSFNLTKKWSFNFSAAYDFDYKDITYSSLGINRDLHCWSMSANIVPYGPYKSYNFIVHVNSSMLSDIKYEKRSDYTTPTDWY